MSMRTKIIAAVIVICFSLSVSFVFALTPQQVIDLKKAGISDKTIQMMMKQEDAAKEQKTVIGMKEVKDKDGNTVIIYSTGESSVSAADDEERKNVERAWQMLHNIIIDKRKKE